MDKIPVYFGNPTSEHAGNFLDMTGIGRLLVLSPYRQLNPLVCFHFQDLLGTQKVFGLNNSEGTSARHQLSESYLERLCLFGESVTYAKLASLMSKGAVIKSTNITDSFSFKAFVARYGECAMPLVYLANGKVNIYTGEAEKLVSGIELISLLPVEAQVLAKEHDLAQQALTADVEPSAAEGH